MLQRLKVQSQRFFLRAAARLSRAADRLPERWLLAGCLGFFLVISLLIFFTTSQAIRAPAPVILVTPIAPPHSIGQPSGVATGKAQLAQPVRRWLQLVDSLEKGAAGQRAFDSLRRVRPQLADSLQCLHAYFFHP